MDSCCAARRPRRLSCHAPAFGKGGGGGGLCPVSVPLASFEARGLREGLVRRWGVGWLKQGPLCSGEGLGGGRGTRWGEGWLGQRPEAVGMGLRAGLGAPWVVGCTQGGGGGSGVRPPRAEVPTNPYGAFNVPYIFASCPFGSTRENFEGGGTTVGHGPLYTSYPDPTTTPQRMTTSPGGGVLGGGVKIRTV